jgi:GTP pyrophosphokinase
MELLAPLFEKAKRTFLPAERELIERAYIFAREAHKTQKRYSGEPYINHVLRSAENLADFGADPETIAAGLLHDTVEDCGVTPETIEKEFSKNIAFLVIGVSKLGNLKYKGGARYAENLRHLFLATAHDVRVILIKLADRLDNIRTLQHVPKEKQKRIALETLEIYAPIANRLGMGKIKSELEDTSFSFAYPKEFEAVNALIRERSEKREKYIKKVYKSLAKEIVARGMKDVRVSYRVKDLYGVYKKILKKEKDEQKIYDVYALRLIVPSIEDCYLALGIIHTMWKPVPERFKDYIANPKVNGYQSLHTTVFTGDGGIAEIQIRTADMHESAEYGLAAHLLYKETNSQTKGRASTERLDWLLRIKDLHTGAKDARPEEFLQNLKIDLFEQRIFAFTPNGDVIELPLGATPLDFAYHIHSEIGNHTSGAMVNGKLVSLDTPLKNLDIVNIQTSKGNHPKRKWLEYAKTTLAQRFIKSYLRENKLS